MYQIVYEILILVLPFVTSPYIARVIGAEGMGEYSYSYTVATYFVLFSNLGIKNYGNRVIAESRDDQNTLNKAFSGVFLTHAFASLISIAVYVIYITQLDFNKIYAEIQLLYVISALFDISWFYFGIEYFKLTVTRNCIVKILNVVFVFLLVKSREDLWIYCVIMSLGMLLSQLTLWVPLSKYVKLIRVDISEIKQHITPMLILFVPVIAVSLYKYMDKIMIGVMSSKIQLGFYENSEKVVNIPTTIITSFGTVMLPKMSYYIAKGSIEKSFRYIRISVKYIMILAFALSFGIASVGSVFAQFFWGEEFSLSGDIIMLLAITIPFVSLASIIRMQYLIPSSKDKEYLGSVVVGAVINFIINCLFIPHLGAIGAALGTVCAEMTVCCVQVFVVRKELPLKSYISSISIPFVFGAIMFFVVYSMRNTSMIAIVTLLLQVLVGGIIYCFLTALYLIYTKDEIFLGIINKILKKGDSNGI